MAIVSLAKVTFRMRAICLVCMDNKSSKPIYDRPLTPSASFKQMSKKPFPGMESKSRFSLFCKTPEVNGGEFLHQEEFLRVHFGIGNCRAGIANLCCSVMD